MLFKRKKKAVSKTPASGPPGVAIYAVGDVHGRLDLLERLTGRIAEDAARLPEGVRPVLVLLGDYIDRGPASAAVIDHVIALQGDARFEVRALKGNHEQALLAFLEDIAIGPAWLAYGGLATVQSYLGRVPLRPSDDEAWETLRESLNAAIPTRHIAFLRDLELHYVAGDYCFVHAGLKPGVPLADQSEDDLLSIRAEFLNARTPFEKTIVYGHTPNFDPVIEPHRIGIDTGAFATGVLTCLKLLGTETEIIQARV